MLGRAIRKIGRIFYRYPSIAEDIVRSGKFGRLKIALVTDFFTADCLAAECRVRSLTRANYQQVISEWKPDLVFVESAFHGAEGSWRYELGQQPKFLRWQQPTAIFELLQFAKDRGIPTVFWNKDDGAFFDQFIDVAKKVDYVFTSDSDCVPRYRQCVAEHVPVNTLAMPYQPAFHNFTGFNFTRNEACFTGSYYRRILSERRQFLDMAFDACASADLPLNVYDRNHDRFSRRIEFRYPKKRQLRLHKSVAHRETSRIYKAHMASLNVNSVTDSETMCSRRLLEILACGGIVVTNSSRAVDRFFRDYCYVVKTFDEAKELFARLRQGPLPCDLERAEAGAIYVRQNHTWGHRLEEICAIVKV